MTEDYKSVCDTCGRQTWYEGGQKCASSYPEKKTCKLCRHTKVNHDKIVPCKGTLQAYDDSDLAPQFDQYYKSKERIEVDFGDGLIKRGTVGKTTGWKPAYLLMLKSNSIGSPLVLGKDDKVLKVIKK